MSVATSNPSLPLLPMGTTEKTLHEMLNLALRTPEVGAVNFNILHTLLAAVLQKLDLQNVVAELPAGELSAPSNVAEAPLQKVEQLVSKVTSLEKKIDTISGPSQPDKKDVDLHGLNEKFSSLEEQFQKLTALPSNIELLERSKSRSSPATEIWQQMQLQKKVEANEAGVTRALSLIDDLMREMNKIKEEQNRMRQEMELVHKRIDEASDMSAILDRLSAVEAYKNDIKQLEDLLNQLRSKLAQYPDASEFDTYITWPVLEEALTQHMAKMEAQRKKKEQEEAMETDNLLPSPSPPSSRPSSSSRLSSAKEKFPQATEMLERIGALSDLHSALDDRVVVLEETMPTKQDKFDLDELLNRGKNVPDDLLDQLEQLREALAALQKDKEQDDLERSSLQIAIQNLRAELEKIQALAQAAMDEHIAKQKDIDALYGLVEKLDDVKADKEIVRMELDTKADKRALATKINQDTFEAAIGELYKRLEDLMKKLLLHEEEWQKAAKQLAADIDLKLDREELEALKQYLEKRLRAMKKLLDQLSPAIPADDDAAGFRRQLIPNYQCLSCDRVLDVRPASPVPSIPATSSLPAGKFLKPYSSYEIEHLRQLRGEMSDFDGSFPPGRPCGGSYTMTFPHRRYTRLTHLSDIWHQEEEEEEPVVHFGKEEVSLQGHDGQLYRGRVPSAPFQIPKLKEKCNYGSQHGISPRPKSARQGSRSRFTPRRPMSSGGERRASERALAEHASGMSATALAQ